MSWSSNWVDEDPVGEDEDNGWKDQEDENIEETKDETIVNPCRIKRRKVHLHPWRWYYGKWCPKSAVAPYKRYCIHDAENFRAQFLKEWGDYEDPIRPRKTMSTKGAEYAALKTTIVIPSQPYAYYRVVKIRDSSYDLTPVHKEIHASDRIDLRLLELNEIAKDTNNDVTEWMGNLFLGDIIIVLEIAQLDSFQPPVVENSYVNSLDVDPCDVKAWDDDEGMNAVFDDNFHKDWRVTTFEIYDRDIANDVIITPFGITRGVVTFAGYGMDKAIKTRISECPTYPEIDKPFRASLFRPKQKIDMFILNPMDHRANFFLCNEASKLRHFPHPDTVAYNIKSMTALEASCQKFTTSFGSEDKVTVMSKLQTAMIWTASMMATIENETIDESYYRTVCTVTGIEEKNGEKSVMIIRFKVDFWKTPEKRYFWTKGAIFNLITERQIFRCSVMTAVSAYEKTELLIKGRFSCNQLQGFFDTVGNQVFALIKQIPTEESTVLNILKSYKAESIEEDCNGNAIIVSVYGGEKIIGDRVDEVPKHRVHFRGGSFELDEYQSGYLTGLDQNLPAFVVHSAFGCGKTTSIVASVLECCRKDQTQKSIHLTISMTNSNVVNLVYTAASLKVYPDEANILRLISSSHSRNIDGSLTTSYDFPELVKNVLYDFVSDVDRSIRKIESYDDLTLAVTILHRQQIKINAFSDLVQYALEDAKGSTGKISKEMIAEVFCRIYNPRRISATVGSALRLLATGTWKFLNDRIETIHVDEASQMPQTAFLALVQSFPNARFVLIGDTRQLPAYCDIKATPLTKVLGAESILDRTIYGNHLPRIDLKYVYRSHPSITQLIGGSFYNSQLLSNIHPLDRQTDVTSLQFWPTSYPILFVNSRGRSTVKKTSFENWTEIEVVDELLRTMSRIIDLRDVGIMSFYKAQVKLLEQEFRHFDGFIGTVDSFQGQERDVTIVCLTKSDRDITDFITDSKRMNVALTRARKAMIIIGDCENLCRCDKWETIINRIYSEDNIISDMFAMRR